MSGPIRILTRRMTINGIVTILKHDEVSQLEHRISTILCLKLFVQYELENTKP